MIYLYAIIDRPEVPTPTEPGLGSVDEHETRPYSLAYLDIAAVVSPLITVKALATETNLWRHEAVVEAVMADHTVLPMRFGTMLSSEATVQAIMAAHYADFATNLKRVRGRVELGLRVLWDDDLQIADSRWQMADGSHQLSAISGRSYLLARLEEECQARAWRQRAEALVLELHTHLTRLATESTQQILVTPRLLLTAAYLVERDRVAAFQGKVEALSAAYPTLHFLCTGPWPPYSFVTDCVPMVGGKEKNNACV